MRKGRFIVSRGKRDLNKGPGNSYWGTQLKKFLDGGEYESFKMMDLNCFNDDESLLCARAFRDFRKNYLLPIDIFRIGKFVRVVHLKRSAEGDLITVAIDDRR